MPPSFRYNDETFQTCRIPRPTFKRDNDRTWLVELPPEIRTEEVKYSPISRMLAFVAGNAAFDTPPGHNELPGPSFITPLRFFTLWRRETVGSLGEGKVAVGGGGQAVDADEDEADPFR
jgi:hypothetical protein